MPESLCDRLRHSLQNPDPEEKRSGIAAIQADWLAGRLSAPTEEERDPGDIVPGRPTRPRLVAPQQVPRRSAGTPEGHAALIHALAHIEFNAINLALDAAYRFRGLPRDYYTDWLRVADEEASHFGLLRAHLQSLGYDYGSFDAHDGLWEMAVKTAHDPQHRMALVPRLLEARGLDVSPAIIVKLKKIGDDRGADILEIILRDEIEHVRIGNHWYEYFCRLRGHDPAIEFQQLLREYGASKPRPPLHRAARLAAGFGEKELHDLENGTF